MSGSIPDPAALVRLLWRDRLAPAPRRGPRARVSLDELVEAGITIADTGGDSAVTVRAVADAVGISAMTVYSHVPDRGSLIALMVDQVLRMMPHDDYAALEWRAALAAIARDNREVFAAHPWLNEVREETPPLGPGVIGKYERELGAVASLGLSPLDTDACLTLLVGFARSSARDAAAAVTATDAGTWWESAGPALAEVVGEHEFPLASAIGTAAGEAHGAAHSADHAWRFGLERILDGIESLSPGRG